MRLHKSRLLVPPILLLYNCGSLTSLTPFPLHKIFLFVASGIHLFFLPAAFPFNDPSSPSAILPSFQPPFFPICLPPALSMTLLPHLPSSAPFNHPSAPPHCAPLIHWALDASTPTEGAGAGCRVRDRTDSNYNVGVWQWDVRYGDAQPRG
jgi:hypothetical protein